MRHGVARAVAHNLAHSIGSGYSILLGIYELNVFTEAAKSPNGILVVDMLNGRVIAGRSSPKLRKALKAACEHLPDFCVQHGIPPDTFRKFKVAYRYRPIDSRFEVTVEDRAGRRSVSEYDGSVGARLRILDKRGRIVRQAIRKGD